MRNRIARRNKLAALLLLLGLVSQGSASAQVKEVRRVLVFNDFGSISSPGIAEMDREIFDALDSSPYRIEFYNENLEITLFSEEVSQPQFREWYIRRYSNHRPDVIITVGPAALRFVLEMHEEPFKDTPVVFCGIMELPDGLRADPRFTGAWSDVRTEQTMEAALRLQPDTRHVVVVGGVGSLDRQGQAIVREKLRGYESKLDFTYLTDLSMSNLLERLKLLPRDTVVLHTAITQDAAGERFIDATQAVPMVAEAASAPVFVLDDVDVRGGAVGGDVLSWATMARDAGKIAVRILNGEKPQDIPIVRSDNVFMFDWQALQRWGFKESDLPLGSEVLNRETSFWESYKQYLITAFFLLVMQTLVIAGLLWQRARRREAQTELIRSYQRLGESEERFRLVANAAPVMIWMSGVDKLCTYCNRGWLEFTGRSLEEELGSGWSEGIHPEDLSRCLETYSQSFDRRESFTMEYRLRRHDGEYRWVFDQGVPRFETDGSFVGYIGSCIDVTERKLAEEIQANTSRKLLEAQEQERTRVARELHDDISQQLGLLSVGISQMKEALPLGQLRSQMDELEKQASVISADIQSLSHELHSSKLEYLGLVLAMKSFCKEFGDRHSVKVDFDSESIPTTLSREVALCLFRVMQEGLRNALKHSGVRFFKVNVQGSPTEIWLSVRDSGVGFEPESAKDTQGLGLISMRERVRLVNGTISIMSSPQSGAEVFVFVPLSAGATTDQTKSAGA